MRKTVKEWGAGLIRVVALTVAGKAILLVLAHYGYHPDEWLARQFDAEMAMAVGWLLVATFAIVGTVLWEVYDVSGSLRRLFVDGKSTWPDFEKWDQRRDFKLAEAAYLWANQEPRGFPLSSEAARAFRKLEKAIEDRDLDVRRDDLREVIQREFDRKKRGKITKANPDWVASRADLRSCAFSLRDKPPFLFPEART